MVGASTCTAGSQLISSLAFLLAVLNDTCCTGGQGGLGAA